MQPPSKPLSDLGFVHQTIRKLPVASGRPTETISEVLADLTSQEWERLKTWEVPGKHKIHYATCILRELSMWTTGKDREGNRTTNVTLLSLVPSPVASLTNSGLRSHRVTIILYLN